MPTNGEMKEFLARAKSEYRAALPEKLDELEQGIGRLEQQPDCCDELRKVFDGVHRLSGTAGSFGLDEIGSVADEWERKIRELRSCRAAGADYTAMRTYIARIRALL